MSDCNENQTPATESCPVRLFIVGERSGNPADWSDWGPRTLVLARSAEEAQAMAEHSSAVAEVQLDKPGVLLTTEGLLHDNI